MRGKIGQPKIYIINIYIDSIRTVTEIIVR